eukprot:9039554-Heterocapsa_arctica.AAC.1
MELDQEVFGAIAALKGAAWIAGGDWNRTPEMIAVSGAVEPIGGFIAAGEGQVETCVPEKKGSTGSWISSSWGQESGK